MSEKADTRRIFIFLACAFGIAWVTSLIVYLTGGLVDSPVLMPELNLTLALVLVAGPVMWAPALAHILTRVVTGEGWQDASLRPRIRRGWPWWVAAWFGPVLLTIVGMVVYFLLFPEHYDSDLTVLRQMLEQGPVELYDVSIWVLVAAQLLQAAILAPVINAFFTFGEEFGWRGYLQPKLMGLGPRRAMVVLGIIWGVWHWPVILMGHNYGLDYPGAPVLGPLAMVWFTLMVGTFLGWLTLRGRSVWPAVIGHAAVNGVAGLGAIFVRGTPNPVLGPLPVGVVGGVGFAVIGLALLLIPGLWEDGETTGH